MTPVLTVALPVFAVMAAGLTAGRAKLASAEDAAALNRFVFRFAMPAALFGLMSGASGLTAADGALALAYGAPAMAVIAAAYVIARNLFALDPQAAGAHALASTLGNAVFLGLPIVMSIEGWARPFVVLMLVEGILVIGVGAALMAPRGESAGALAANLRGFIVRPLRNPLVAAALAGFVFATIGVDLPGPVRSFFDILGRAAGPTALFSIGLFLATHQFPSIASVAGKVSAIAVMKMIALPALCYLAAAALGIAIPEYRAALALFCAVPTAVGAYVMTTQYGRYTAETAAAVAATTALSVLTISAVLVIFA